MNVEIYRMSDCWRLITAAKETCILGELPAFFDILDFRNHAGNTVRYKLLFFKAAAQTGNRTAMDKLYFVGELV